MKRRQRNRLARIQGIVLHARAIYGDAPRVCGYTPVGARNVEVPR